MASSTAAGRKRKAETSPERPAAHERHRKAPRITAEMEQVVQCPICLSVPLGEILQCGNGHTVCQPCQEKTERDTCAQCRGQMKSREGDWMRSRTLEDVLDKMAIPCPFLERGCPEVLPRAELREHLEECDKSGNVIQICRYLPGGRDCDFKVNCTRPREACRHLEDHHKGCRYNKVLNVGVLRDKCSYPAFIGGVTDCLLITSADHGDDAVHFLALCLEKTEEGVRVRMKITIKSPSDEVADLKLEIPVVAFLDGPAAFQKRRLIRFSKSTLEEQYRNTVTGKIHLVIKIKEELV